MEKQIRILHCFGKINKGGAETMIMNLYNAIDRNKIQFDFVKHTKEKCSYEDEIYELGGKVFSIPRLSLTNIFLYINSWRNLFITYPNRWVAIQGHMFITSAIYFMIAKRFGLITVAHSHSISNGSGLTSVFKFLFEIPIKYISDYFFACSSEAGKWLFGKRVCKSDRFYILKNAINASEYVFDIKKREKNRKELLINEKFVICHIGRFEKVKNHFFILKIFNELIKINKKFHLLLIGDGILFNKVKKRIFELKLEKYISLIGQSNEVQNLLQATDLFILPSLYEGIPVSLIEAQTTSLPCLVSSSISKDSNITGLVKYISLKKPISFWVNEILRSKKIKRNNMKDIIKKAGFDVKSNVAWLEHFYLYEMKRKDRYNL